MNMSVKLGATFYPTTDPQGKEIPFEKLFIPHIYREIYFEGVYVDIFNQKKDMVVVDVGANIGIVTQYMRPYCKKIYAIEPSSEHFTALKKNKEFNEWDNVEIFNFAIADKDGDAQLSYEVGNRTSNSIVNNYGAGGETVKTKAIDTFFEENKLDKVDFMKFDVEGADDLILRSEGFKKVAPKISAIEVEFHKNDWEDLVKYMIGLGYEARRYPSSAIIVLFTR